MPKHIQINGVDVKPGQQMTINIPVARLHTHTKMNMPLQVIRGRRKGPVVFVSAAVHGDEILGVEILRRLIRHKPLKRMCGTLIAVPVVNVFGFIEHSRYLPDRRDLNRFFPGSGKGSLASRLASIFMTEVVDNCTHGIDLHTGSNHRINLPQVRAHLDDAQTRDLAVAFGAPVVIDANMRDGSLRQAVMEKGIPMLLYEAVEALRFDEAAIRTGFKGILSVMRRIGMLPEIPAPLKTIDPLIARSTVWLRASKSGILRTRILLGDAVRQHDRVGVISDLFGDNEAELFSPVSGVVIGRLDIPLVHEGDAVFHIACFEEEKITEHPLDGYEEAAAGIR